MAGEVFDHARALAVLPGRRLFQDAGACRPGLRECGVDVLYTQLHEVRDDAALWSSLVTADVRDDNCAVCSCAQLRAMVVADPYPLPEAERRFQPLDRSSNVGIEQDRSHSRRRRRAVRLHGRDSTRVLASPPLTADELDRLAAALEGRLVPAGSREYERAHKLWNSRFDGSRPAAIVEVAGTEDIRRVIDFARRHDVPVAARNGGHSFGGYSTGDGVIVIDVSRLDSIEVSADAGRARIGAGATLLPAYQALAPHRRAIPGGFCPTVGITGLTAGGGLGVLGRRHGLTCDSLTEVELVDAEGTLLRANVEEHADLFWALRGGGGGNFGVVVAHTFRLVPVDVLFTHTAVELPWAAAERVVTCWQEWAHAAPRELWSGVRLETRGRTEEPLVVVETFYGGNPEDVPVLVDDLAAAIGAQPTATVATTGEFATIPSRMYCEGLRREEWHTEDLHTGGRLPRSAYYAKSDVASSPWPPAAVAALLTAIEERRDDPLLTPSEFDPPRDTGRIFIEIADGAIGSVAADATAFPHRDAVFVSQFESRWRTGSPPELEAPNIAWACELYSAVGPSGSCYLGYIDPELVGWERAYYGANLPRLQRVKATYDPDNFFRFARSIPPAGQHADTVSGSSGG